jgi:hypothetical protein
VQPLHVATWIEAQRRRSSPRSARQARQYLDDNVYSGKLFRIVLKYPGNESRLPLQYRGFDFKALIFAITHRRFWDLVLLDRESPGDGRTRHRFSLKKHCICTHIREVLCYG